MILAAHHPAYLPDITFLAKMLYSDILVLTDDFQYSKHAQINRCRIKTVHGIQWLTVPVLTSGKGAQSIAHVEIERHLKWRRRHKRSIEVNYTYSAYYEPVMEMLVDIYNRKWRFLCEMNIALIERFCSFLNLDTKVALSSEIRDCSNGFNKIIALMEFYNCTIYLADACYAGYVKAHWPDNPGRDLHIGEYYPVPYFQQFGEFIGNLSMIDLIFNEGLNSVAIARQSFKLRV